MRICFVFRRKNPRFFSIERVFGTIIPELSVYETEQVEMPAYGLTLKNFLALRRIVKEKPECIFHLTGDCTYLAIALPRNRTVVTFHDAVFLHQQKGWKRWLLGLLFIRLPVWWAKYITTISAATRNELIAFTGCAPDKIRVIGNPLTGAVIRAEKDFDVETPNILFVGVTPNKNLFNVARALEGLRCQLHIVGMPDAEQEKWLEKYGISFASYQKLSDIEMAAMYTKSDIVLFPTLYEGFGLPILEGFQAGRIVITSNRDPMKTIADGAAILVDPENYIDIRKAVDLAIHNQDLRAVKIDKGFEVVARYQPAKIASAYAEVYRQVSNTEGFPSKKV